MKRIMLLAAMAITMGVQAQNVHKDTALGHQFVRIQPIKWRYNMPEAVRLYVWGVYDNLSDMGRIHWELRDSVYIDAVTRNYNLIDQGEETISGDDYEAWDPASLYLFPFIAGRLNVTLR